MRWDKANFADTKYVAELVGDDLSYVTGKNYEKEAVAWCRNNRIFFWNSMYGVIRFTNEKDLTLFLLRFG